METIWRDTLGIPHKEPEYDLGKGDDKAAGYKISYNAKFALTG